MYWVMWVAWSASFFNAFATGAETVLEGDGSSAVQIPDIVVPLALTLNEDRYLFHFECTFDEASDALLLTKKVVDFCYESLIQLRPHWIHFYADPTMCQSDVVNAVKEAHDNSKLALAGVEPAEKYTLTSDQWCTTNSWLQALHGKEKAISSQGGQDGILEYIFSKEGIGAKNKYYVEIGFNSDQFEGGSGANTYNLHLQGWTGLLLDITYENATINLRKHRVTPDNIVDIFDMYEVPIEPDYVSIDIDSQDLWVLRAILASGKYRPRAMTVEFNANLPYASTVTVEPNSELAGANVDLLFGASMGAVKMVAEEFGYSVVYVINKLDVVLVRNDLITGGACALPFLLAYYKVAKVQHCIIHPGRMFKWVEYGTWRRTNGNIELARSAAAEQLVEYSHSKSPSKNAKDRELKCLGIDMQKLILQSYVDSKP